MLFDDGTVWLGLARSGCRSRSVGSCGRSCTTEFENRGQMAADKQTFFFSPCLPFLPIPTFEFATLPSWRNWRASRGWNRTWRGKATARQRRERDGGEKRLLLALVGVSAQKGVTGWRRSAKDERHEVDLGGKGKKKEARGSGSGPVRREKYWVP